MAHVYTEAAVPDIGVEEQTMGRKDPAGYANRSSTEAAAVIPEYSDVTLTHDLEYRGVSYPKGTHGVVVHKHNDDAYEVEFAYPAFSVITLAKEDIVTA